MDQQQRGMPGAPPENVSLFVPLCPECAITRFLCLSKQNPISLTLRMQSSSHITDNTIDTPAEDLLSYLSHRVTRVMDAMRDILLRNNEQCSLQPLSPLSQCSLQPPNPLFHPSWI
jgi:hypothetical protein